MRIVPPAPVVPGDPSDLIFQWERRSHVHWRLAGIIALSLLAHAVSFYVLQVSYTPTGAQLPPPAQVVMVPLDQPGNDAFARWLAMADPSLAVQPVAPSPEDTLAALDFHYVPSYKVARPGFKSLDPVSVDGANTAPPLPRLPGPVPLDLFTSDFLPRAPVPSAAGQSTRVVLTGGIYFFLDSAMIDFYFYILVGSEPLEPTIFLVGARPEGGPPFVFLKSKPDNAAADEYARDYVARLTFRPTDLPPGTILWGWAEFAWGNGIYLPPEKK